MKERQRQRPVCITMINNAAVDGLDSCSLDCNVGMCGGSNRHQGMDNARTHTRARTHTHTHIRVDCAHERASERDSAPERARERDSAPERARQCARESETVRTRERDSAPERARQCEHAQGGCCWVMGMCNDLPAEHVVGVKLVPLLSTVEGKVERVVPSPTADSPT